MAVPGFSVGQIGDEDVGVAIGADSAYLASHELPRSWKTSLRDSRFANELAGISSEARLLEGVHALREAAEQEITPQARTHRARPRIYRTATPAEISHASGLSSYSERAYELLARYFKAELNSEDKTPLRQELASLLVFPDNPRAEAAFRRLLDGSATEIDKTQLNAYAVFPLNSRAADLLALKTSSERALTPDERFELYGNLLYPYFKRDAQALQRQAAAAFTAVQLPDVTEQQIAAQVMSFVRRELKLRQAGTSKHVSSNAELAELLGVDEALVQKTLSAPDGGLTKPENNFRERELSLIREDRRYVFAMAKRRAIAALVSIENEMHRSCLIDDLSAPRPLAELFGVTSPELKKALQLLPMNERFYRDFVLGNGDMDARMRAMVKDVQQEIEAFGRGEVSTFRSDTELAAAAGISPVTVFHYLRTSLPRGDFLEREGVLKLNRSAESHRQSLVEYVREELRAFDKGEIANLTTDRGLAEIFSVGEPLVGRVLRDPKTGLTHKEEKFRQYVFKQQLPVNQVFEAARKARLYAISQAVLEHIDAPVEEGVASGAEKDADTGSAITINGVRFGSAQEAAAAQLLEHYLRDYNFSVAPGESFQIVLKNGRVDFYVQGFNGGVFVEWHPGSISRRGFPSREEFALFHEIQRGMEPAERKAFGLFMEKALGDGYQFSREFVVSQDPRSNGKPIYTVTSPRGLFYLLKHVFEIPPELLPPENIFVEQFWRLRDHLRFRYAGSKSAAAM